MVLVQRCKRKSQNLNRQQKLRRLKQNQNTQHYTFARGLTAIVRHDKNICSPPVVNQQLLTSCCTSVIRNSHACCIRTIQQMLSFCIAVLGFAIKVPACGQSSASHNASTFLIMLTPKQSCSPLGLASQQQAQLPAKGPTGCQGTHNAWVVWVLCFSLILNLGGKTSSHPLFPTLINNCSDS